MKRQTNRQRERRTCKITLLAYTPSEESPSDDPIAPPPKVENSEVSPTDLRLVTGGVYLIDLARLSTIFCCFPLGSTSTPLQEKLRSWKEMHMGLALCDPPRATRSSLYARPPRILRSSSSRSRSRSI